MNLYSYYAYPDCLNQFLKFKGTNYVYDCQLETCYKTMNYYYRPEKGESLKKYIEQIGKLVIISNRLTPLM